MGDKMIAGVYQVKVSGLGFFPKHGIISIRTIDQQLSGSFTLHNKEIPFNYGTFLGNRIELEGSLALPIGKLDYTAKGTIIDGKLDLVLDTEKGRITVTGKRMAEDF